MELDDIFPPDSAGAEAHGDEHVGDVETLLARGISSNGSIFQNLENEGTVGNHQNNIGNLLNQLLASSGIYQSNTTDMSHPVVQNRLTTADPIITYDRSQELQQFNQLDETWINLLKTLRMNETRLTKRNVPRLMVTHNNHNRRLMNCTFPLLLNAPIIIRLIFKLDKGVNSQLIIHPTDQAKQNLFDTLLKIMQMAYEENHDENNAVQLVESFGTQYQAVYSQGVNWIDQDPGVFYLHLMDLFKSMVNDENQAEYFSKALEIEVLTAIANDQLQITKEHVIEISSVTGDFIEYINKRYFHVDIRDGNGQVIQQRYSTLPEQILLVDSREEKNDHILYPIQFQTQHGQRYLITGAVIPIDISSNDNNYVAMICRQDSVYLLNNNRPINQSNINYLPAFLTSVHPRIVLYTEVDPHHEKICALEDPLAGIIGDSPSGITLRHRETEQPAISTQAQSFMPPIDQLPMFMRHPILSTFRCYMRSDYSGKKTTPKLSWLKSCVGEQRLYFSPRSMFVDLHIECALVCRAPDGQYYRAPYEFVIEKELGPRFENPTYLSVDQGGDTWFCLELLISKCTQGTLQSKDKHSEEDNQENGHDEACKLVRYPDGELEIIDDKKLRSLELCITGKNTKRKKTSSKSNNVKPLALSKVIDIHKVYLALRQAHRDGDNKYVPDPVVLFRSNPFRPVSSSIKKEQYDYSSDRLKIESLLREPSPDTNNPSMVYSLSYSIPRETYICTALTDKYIQVTIHKSNDDESIAHPQYQIWDGQNLVNSSEIAATEYSSTLNIHIVRLSQDELENLTNSSAVQGASSSTTVHNSQSTSNSSTIESFCIQLQLGHLSNGQFLGYPKSAVKSDMIRDDMSGEQQSSPSAPAADVIESNDTLTDPSPAYLKRSHTDENDVSADSTPKCIKLN